MICICIGVIINFVYILQTAHYVRFAKSGTWFARYSNMTRVEGCATIEAVQDTSGYQNITGRVPIKGAYNNRVKIQFGVRIGRNSDRRSLRMLGKSSHVNKLKGPNSMAANVTSGGISHVHGRRDRPCLYSAVSSSTIFKCRFKCTHACTLGTFPATETFAKL